jgi:hypothetical protein
MRLRIIISFLTLFFVTHVLGQTRTLTGKVIDDKFNPLPIVSISNADTVLLARTDMNGNFSITIPPDTKKLIVATVGMEWKSLDISDSCSNLEIILLPRPTYDFMTLGKVDRLRKKQFDKLPKLHKSAFEKGVFKSEKPCYVDKFIPIKKRLKEIHKIRTQ